MASDKHRMKRPKPKDNVGPARNIANVREACQPDQLEEIGAIALIWNQVELQIDFILLVILKLPPGLWLPTVKRINGMDGKLEIIRRYYDRNVILTDDASSALKVTFDAVGEYKGYRDAIVHSVLFDVESGIAERIGSRAEISQVIVKIEALKAFYQRMELLLPELKEADLLLRLGDAEDARNLYGGQNGEKIRREKDVPIQTQRLSELQNLRLELPPLPAFPAGEEEVPLRGR